MKRTIFAALTAVMLALPANCLATKLLGVKVIDKDYLMVHFRDGEVHYLRLLRYRRLPAGSSVLRTTRPLPQHSRWQYGESQNL